MVMKKTSKAQQVNLNDAILFGEKLVKEVELTKSALDEGVEDTDHLAALRASFEARLRPLRNLANGILSAENGDNSMREAAEDVLRAYEEVIGHFEREARALSHLAEVQEALDDDMSPDEEDEIVNENDVEEPVGQDVWEKAVAQAGSKHLLTQNSLPAGQDMERQEDSPSQIDEILKRVSSRAVKYLTLYHNCDEFSKRLAMQIESLPEGASREAFERRWLTAIGNVHSVSGENRANAAKMVLEADYNLLFNAGRKPVLSAAHVRPFMKKAMDFLHNGCPCRGSVAQDVLICFTRRLLGESTATFPVLYGPPGGGKTHMARMVAEALSAAGIPTDILIYSMAKPTSSLAGDEMTMCLCGTDSHWSNSDSGQIYKKVAMTGRQPLLIVVLDEADKAPEKRNLLMNLLDPDQPLMDNFVSSFFPEHDLRQRVLFLLTANNIDALAMGNDDPLASRLTKIAFEAYSRKEMVEVVTQLGVQRLAQQYSLSPGAFRDLANDAIDELGMTVSFRKIMDRVGELAFLKNYRSCLKNPGGMEKKIPIPEPRPQKMGFI
ncbi:ATP-binding protein [Thiovibrio sp. JS02]